MPKGIKVYTPCTGCGRLLRPDSPKYPASAYPNTVRHGGKGMCPACNEFERTHKNGTHTGNIRRQVIPTYPKCVSCGALMRRYHEKSSDHPGTVRMASKEGLCAGCVKRRERSLAAEAAILNLRPVDVDSPNGRALAGYLAGRRNRIARNERVVAARRRMGLAA